MSTSIFDDYARDYHQQEYELSFANGTTDQFVQDIYHFDPLDLDDTIDTPPWDEIERMNRRAEELRHDAEYQREIRDSFAHMARSYSDYWKKDKTPPEKRDALFYARRYASLYETLERKSEYWIGFPDKDYDSLDSASERYAEKVSILEGKTPEEHYMRRWRFKEDHWRFWPNPDGVKREEEFAI